MIQSYRSNIVDHWYFRSCSTLEAMILSVSTAELKVSKKLHPKEDSMEKFHHEIEETTSAILSPTQSRTLWGQFCRRTREKHLGDGQTDMFWFGVRQTRNSLLR